LADIFHLIVVDSGEIIAKDDPLPGMLSRDNTIGTSKNNAALEIGKLVYCSLPARVFHVELGKIVLKMVIAKQAGGEEKKSMER
jgi:hypothetical protein